MSTHPPRSPSNTARNAIVSAVAVILGAALIIAIVIATTGDRRSPLLPDSTDASAAETNDVGNIEADLGQPVEFTDQAGAVIARMTVTDIKVDPKVSGCDDLIGHNYEFHLIIVHITAETTTDLHGTWGINSAYGWTVVGPDGQVSNEANRYYMSCSGAEMPDLGPGQNSSGLLALESEWDSGKLIYTEPGLSTGPSYEWEF